MESMFMIGDKVVKVEHLKTISRMLYWNLNEKNVWFRDNLESIDFASDFDQEKTFFRFYM